MYLNIDQERALLFEATSEDVLQMVGRRNCKVKVIFVIAALSLVLLIILPIATKSG
jgi:hypothetical protein